METKTTLHHFLDNSPTSFHATKELVTLLVNAGYTRLHEEKDWDLKAGQGYFVTRNDSSIIAFNYPGQERLLEGLKMVGAHTDSPALKIKPLPELKQAGVNQLAVETYGGVLLNPWFDRDLGLAGRVTFEGSDGTMSDQLIDFKKAVACIPSLAIHLDREANDSRSINAQEHLPAVISLEQEKSFHDLVSEAAGSDTVSEVLGFDLLLYDFQKSATVGMDDAFIASARLDNLLSCYCGVSALIASGFDQGNLLVCNDHEEIGSRSSHGAASNFLELVLKRLAGSDADFAKLIHHSMLISADNAHALHPNYQSIHEKNHAPLIGKGVVLKYNADQAYATESQGASFIKALAKREKLELQSYVVRTDQRCGSTIGPITAAKLGIKTVDIGIPTWAMHSIRETAAYCDIEAMITLLKGYYTSS